MHVESYKHNHLSNLLVINDPQQNAGMSAIPQEIYQLPLQPALQHRPPNGPTSQPYLNPSGHSPAANPFPKPEDKNWLNILVPALLIFSVLHQH